jgi:hypothetical protein
MVLNQAVGMTPKERKEHTENRIHRPEITQELTEMVRQKRGNQQP